MAEDWEETDSDIPSTRNLRGPDGLIHTYAWNSETQAFDMDLGVSQAAPQLGPTGDRVYQQGEVTGIANQPGVTSVVQKGYDYVVTYDDGSTQRFYQNGRGGYSTSAPTKPPADSTASGKITLSKGSVPQVQERYQNTKLGGQTTGGGTTATTPYTDVQDAVNAILERYSVQPGPIGTSIGAPEGSGTPGAIASQLAQGHYGTNAGIINAYGGGVSPNREAAELDAQYLHNLQLEYEAQGRSPTQAQAAIELQTMNVPQQTNPAGFDPSNPMGTQTDPVTGRFNSTTGIGSSQIKELDYARQLALRAAGYAKGGTMRLQEPSMVIGLVSKRPLAMIGEAGMQETMSDRGNGRIQITPTNDEITMGREQNMGGRIGTSGRPPSLMSMAGRIGGSNGARPLGVRGFQYGGTIDTGPTVRAGASRYRSEEHTS